MAERVPSPITHPRDPALYANKGFFDWLRRTVLEHARAWLTIKPITGPYALVTGDDGLYLRTTGTQIIVPPQSTAPFPDGAVVHIRCAGAAQLTVVQGPTVTITTAATLKGRAQHSSIMLVHVTGDLWDLLGDLEPL
jgi:hypothetical protein